MQMHVGYNFGSETCRMLWMIPHEKMTDEFHANPVYDDHYMNFRDPIVLHKEPVHSFEQHSTLCAAQLPGRRGPAVAPRRPPSLATGRRSVGRPRPGRGQRAPVPPRQWLHFVTGSDFTHQFLTSFAYSTDEFQFGTVKIPPNRITNAIQVGGERVYYPMDDSANFIVNLMDTNASLIGTKGDAIFVPAGVAHQFQNPEDRPWRQRSRVRRIPEAPLYDD